MRINLEEAFERHDDEYLEFERIESPRTKRRDLHAFLMLDELVPSDRNIIRATGHDELWISTDCAELADVITDEQVRDLIRCGIMYDGDVDALCMYA